jgi:hypothetical protein
LRRGFADIELITIALRRGIAMKYFDETDDKYQRIGKVIGDIISAIIVIGLMAIFAYSLMNR